MQWPFLYNALNQVGQELVSEIKNQLSQDKKNASGALSNSIAYDISATKDGYELNIMAEDYLKYVDKGRKPGSKMPPSNKLIPWVESRGIKFDGASTPQVAFVIARSIGEKGIAATNIIQKSIDIVYGKRQILISDAVKQDIMISITNAWNS